MGSGDFAVGFGSPVAKELPGLPHFLDFFQIEIGYQYFVPVAAGLSKDFAARISKSAFAVELADIPRRFDAYAVDRAHKISVSDRMRGLFEFPKIFTQPRDGGGRVKYDLRSIQPQHPCAFREMPIVANVNAYSCGFRLERRIAAISRSKIKLLPESR